MVDSEWIERVNSLIGIEPSILKAGNHEQLLSSLVEGLPFNEFPLKKELYDYIGESYGKFEAKHNDPDDIRAHREYAMVHHDLIILTGAKKVVELGILNALSSSAYIRALSRINGHLTSFDPNISCILWPWIPPEWQRYWTFHGWMGQYAYGQLKDSIQDIDLLYIDTEHTYSDTKDFLSNHWIRNVRPGGYVILDDCCPQFQAGVDLSKVPSDYWIAVPQGLNYGILRPVLEFIEDHEDDLDYVFTINNIHSTGICVMKFKEGHKFNG